MSGLAADEDYFESLYRDSADPWGFRTRWYEQRKRALTLAALPHRRYRSALEAGCATGELAAGLAGRCERLLACDFHEGALQQARLRLAGYPQARVERRRLPQDWPDGVFELIVVSELGYYLGDRDLDELLRRTRAGLSDGAVLLACHWRHRFAEAVRDGDAVHAAFAALGLPRLLRHEEPDFLLEAWSPDPTSVAAREGLSAMTDPTPSEQETR